MSMWKMLIGGKMVSASDGGTTPTSSPSTGELLAEFPAATPDDVDRAVATAAAAQREWAAMLPRERGAVLRKMAAVLRANREELGLLDAKDGGNPVTAMTGDVELGAEMLEMFAEWGSQLGGMTMPGAPEMLHYTVREPYGVVARLVPYNHPIMFATTRIAAPLMAGNAVVLKAPDQTPLSALRMAELFADVVPAGVLSVLTGPGSRVGSALVGHPDIRRIAFTGSVPTGRSILRNAADHGIKNVSLELGGKNPLIVLEDADLEAAAQGAITGMNFHWTAGQSCGSTSRLLVHRSLYEGVLERIIDGARAVRMGDPLDPETEMGCMVNPRHRDNVVSFIEAGRSEGLRLLTGGNAPGPGAFVEPTIFADVPETSRLFQEEIFGPVLAVTPFDTDDEAVALANNSDFGLTASIWSRDLGRAQMLARRIDAGYMWVNTGSRHFAGMPFGGVKDSGLGSEESVEELHSFTVNKAVSVKMA